MQKINIKKLIYIIRNKYMTLNNVVIAVAFLVAANWVWGALDMMQRNYSLQKEVDNKHRLLQLTELQRDSLALQKRYYQTEEYQELAVRESLGLVRQGEKVLVLPKAEPQEGSGDELGGSLGASQAVVQTSNFEQWLNFLFGGHAQSVSSQNK